MMVIALIAIAPNARAEIASKAYVDDTAKELIFGTTNPSSNDATFYEHGIDNNIVGGIRVIADTMAEMGSGVKASGNRANGMLVTDDDGDIQIATGGYITNNNISSSASIDLGKLHMPTPPASCATKGCMLMFYHDSHDNPAYVWEPVTRDTNETIAGDGRVTASSSSANDARLYDVNTTVNYDGPNSDIAEEKADCEASGGTWSSGKGCRH
jgi:hypothetical protein